MTILIYIAEHEGCMKSDIYRDIVHNSSLPKRFDRLEEAGLIVQTRDDRATRLSLTAAGRQVAARLMEIRDLMVPRCGRTRELTEGCMWLVQWRTVLQLSPSSSNRTVNSSSDS